MKKYIGLIHPNRLKTEFILNFISVFSSAENVKTSFDYIKTDSYNKYVTYNTGGYLNNSYYDSKRDLLNKTFNGVSLNKWEVLGVSETQYALINKVESMLDKGGLKDVLIMLNSFSRGTKRLKSNPHNRITEALYEWTEKDGNEKLSHKGNLPKAHFRWNYQAHTLNEAEIRRVKEYFNIKLLENINI